MPDTLKDYETVTAEITVAGAVSKLSTHIQTIRVEKRINKISRG